MKEVLFSQKDKLEGEEEEVDREDLGEEQDLVQKDVIMT